MIVTLSQGDMDYAKNIGLRRYETNRRANNFDARVMGDKVRPDIIGAQAELAVSKALGLPWDGKLFSFEDWEEWRLKGHDVGPIEVRSTPHPRGRLILHPNDKDESPYLLVRAHEEPTFHIVGWQWGKTGKKVGYWEDVGYGKPCFYVPREKLRPIKELIEGLGLCVSRDTRSVKG